MSIQLDYVDGLALNLILNLGQPFTVRSTSIGERIIRLGMRQRNRAL